MAKKFIKRIFGGGLHAGVRRSRLSLIAVAFVFFLGSLLALKQATGQICSPGSPCSSIAAGVAPSLTSTFPMDIAPALATAQGAITAAFTAVFTQLQIDVQKALDDALSDIHDWLDVMWDYDLKPNMQDMTGQIGGTNEVDQSRALTSFTDAQEQDATQMTHQEHEKEDDLKYSENQFACVAGTNMGGMQRARYVRTAFATSMGLAELPRESNSVGTPAANGPAADQNVRWVNYKTRYCNPNANAGASGCAAAGTFPDADVDVGNNLFGKETIDVRVPDVKQNMDDLMTNIVGPFTEPAVMPDTLGSVGGREVFLRRQSMTARRQAAREALNFIAARRVPGSQMATFLTPLRTASGVNPATISNNPSYEEVMNAMVAERMRSGRYQVDLVDEPENVQREIVIGQALQVMQMNDQLDLLDRMAVMLAAEVGGELGKYRTPSAASAAPIQ